MRRGASMVAAAAALALPLLSARGDIWKEDPSKKKSKPSVKWRDAAGDPKRDLKVKIDPNAPADFKADVKAAMQNWNNAGTAWSFAQAGDGETPDINVRIGRLSGKLGVCHQTTKRGKDDGKGGQKQCDHMDIVIDDDGGGRGWEQPGDDQATRDRKWNRERIIKHELGHAIGLDHTHDVRSFAKDVMVDGRLQDPANDAPTLTQHDKDEAGTSNAVCSVDPVGTRPGYVATGRPELVAITSGAGSDLLLNQATAIQLQSVIPADMQMQIVNVDDLQITAQVFVRPGAATDQGFFVALQYPFGQALYSGILATGENPDPGLMPHAAYAGPPVEQFTCFEPVVLDGSPSTHDDPNAYFSAMWNIDGARDNTELIFEEAAIGPGVHTATLMLTDRWGHQSAAEKTVIVGRPFTHVDKLGRGGGISQILVDPAAPGWMASHGDFVTGEVLFSMSDGSTLTTEVVAQAAVNNQFTSLARDPQSGQLYLAFYDNTVPGLFLATRTGPGQWNVEPVPDPLGHDDGDFCRMDVDFDGRVHVVHVNYTTDELRYALRDAGGWTVETIAPLGGALPWAAIDLNGFGQPNVAWTNQRSIFYAKKTQAGWRVETVAADAAANSFTTCDLKMDGNDDPVIVYVNARSQPTIARFDGLDWTLEPTLTVNQAPLMISAIVDEGVEVHMAYLGPGLPNPKAVYLTRRGGQWTEIVLDADVGAGSFLGTSIGLSAAHTPCASYLGGTGGRQELRVACIGVRCEGDVNCDGVMNAQDIEAFILALFDPDAYMNRYPDCDILLADMNGDGLVTALDIEGFIDALFG